MKKETFRKKLTFKKTFVANLNQDSAKQLLGGAQVKGNTDNTCVVGCVPDDPQDISKSTGCFSCECDSQP